MIATFQPFELYFQGNSLLRALNVAAFAVSGYASSEGRHCKPFNPLLGETYEADFPDKGVRFFSEKVRALYNLMNDEIWLVMLVVYLTDYLELNSGTKKLVKWY